ncbi:hypothetical protein [Nocardia beijingensis]
MGATADRSKPEGPPYRTGSRPPKSRARRVGHRETHPNCVYKEYSMAGYGLYVTHAEQLNDDLLEFMKS